MSTLSDLQIAVRGEVEAEVKPDSLFPLLVASVGDLSYNNVDYHQGDLSYDDWEGYCKKHLSGAIMAISLICDYYGWDLDEVAYTNITSD